MGRRPDVVDWGVVGEIAALRKINTRDPVDLERYWETNTSTPPGLMVADINTLEELADNAKLNGRREGFTFAISGTSREEKGEFQGFVLFTADYQDTLRAKIHATSLFVFPNDIALWEISYAKYPSAAPHQVASGVRQGCVLLVRKLGTAGFYPRVAIIACVGPDENPGSVQVLRSACFDPIGSVKEKPAGIIRYEQDAPGMDSVWLLNWNVLNYQLRQRAAHQFEKTPERSGFPRRMLQKPGDEPTVDRRVVDASRTHN